MRHRLSKILHYLGSKLQSCLEFIKFVFVPRQKYFIIGTFVIIGFSVFVLGRAAYAWPIPSWEDIMHLLNSVLFMFASMLGWVAMKIFALVIMVCQYNTFVTSPAVNKAWVLVRDVCNMGFVVILLIIAFAQILNVQKYSIKTLLPKVLITAVLINFSKLLCGLMIDVSQVVMMTFVNGFQATAGANLVNGLGLTKLMKMSAQNAETGSAQGNSPSGAQIFLALCLGILILVAMIVVMFFIALILVMRIVTLWLLVILAPAAWAFGMFPGMGEGKYNDWWKKFGSTVAVGPFMAFFLWISLLVMSNPDQMIANMNEMNAGIEAKGGDKPAAGYLDNLAQAAMGLALLMASLIAAQEGGGAIGKMASKGQSVATAAVQKTAMKFSGAKFAADRGKAAYSGYKAQADAKQAEKLKSWSGAGAKVASTQNKIQANLIHPVSAVKAAGAGIKKGAETYSKTRAEGGGVLKSLSAGKKAAAKEGKARFMKDQGGKINMRMANSIDSNAHKEAMEKAKTSMKNRGIESDTDLDDVISGKIKASDAEKKNALLMKAERGNLTEKQAKDGKEMMGDDAASADAFKTSMKKKQVHLAYNFDDAGERAQFDKDVKAGDIDLTKQSVDAYKDQKFMSAAVGSLGAKAFGDQMKKVGDRSDEHKEAVKNTVKDPAFAPTALTALNNQRTVAEADVTKKTTELAGLTAGSPAHTKKQEELNRAIAVKTKADTDHANTKKALPEAIAKVSGDLDMAFTRRDDNGVPHPAGHPEAGIDQSGLSKYVKDLDAKGLAKLNLSGSSDAVKHGVASSVNANALNNLAKSNVEGSNEQVQELTKAMAAFVNSPPLNPATSSSAEIAANEDKKATALKELLKAVSKDETSAAFGDKETAILTAVNAAQGALNSRRAAAGAAPVQSAQQEKEAAEAAASVTKAAADATAAANAATAAAARDAALAQAIADALRRGGPPPSPPPP